MKRFFNIISGLLLLYSCDPSGKQLDDTPTSGNISISVDESFKPLTEFEVQTFEGIYTYAVVTPRYKPEADVMKDLKMDSARIAIIARDLDSNERNYFTSKKLHPQVLKIAVDAVALIVNKENSVKKISETQVKDILIGKTTSWKQIDSTATETAVIFVFDNAKSSNARFLREKLMEKKAPFPKNCFAVESNKEVIDYISKNKNAIGVIGMNWIGDIDDKNTKTFLEQIKTLSVSSEVHPEEFFQPAQDYIADGRYPFTRNVYIINPEGRAGLGTGFAAFVAGDKGQRIVRLNGLIPAVMPERIINFNGK